MPPVSSILSVKIMLCLYEKLGNSRFLRPTITIIIIIIIILSNWDRI